MAAQWYAMVVDDPARADARWPEDAPHSIGQARSFGSEAPGDEERLDRGITPLTIRSQNGIEAIPIDHQPGDGERWDAKARAVVPVTPDYVLTQLKAQRAALDAQIAVLTVAPGMV